MPVKLKRFFFFVVYILFSVLFIFLQSSGLCTLQIGTMSALLVLPCVAYGGFYFGCYTGALIGFLLGVLTDVFSEPFIFNAVALTLIGFACGLVMMYLFNRNLAAACVLSFAVSLVYFFAKWLITYAFVDPTPAFILFRYSLPSALYTGVVGVALYFVIRPIFNKFPTQVRK